MGKNTIGKFIAELRHDAGYTQKELAEKLFVSHKTVSRWETGETLPDISLLPVIAEIFGITTDELLDGERKAPAAETAPSPKADEEIKATPAPEKKTAASVRGERELMRMVTATKTRYTTRAINSVAIAALGFLISYTVWTVSPGGFRDAWSLAVISALFIDLFAIYFLVMGTVNSFMALDVDEYKDKKRIKEQITAERRGIAKRTFIYVSLIILIFVLTVTWLHLGDIVEFLLCSLIFAPITSLVCLIVSVIVWDRLEHNGIIE